MSVVSVRWRSVLRRFGGTERRKQAKHQRPASAVCRCCLPERLNESYHRIRTLLSPLVARYPSRSATTTRYCIVDQQHHDRPDNCDDHAVNINAGNAGRAEEIEQKSTHQGADNPQRDVDPKTLALFVDNLASDEPSNQAEYDPADDAHVVLLQEPRSSRVQLQAHLPISRFTLAWSLTPARGFKVTTRQRCHSSRPSRF